MVLVAIYNVWDDFDWLERSIKQIEPLIDDFLIVASEYSHYGEYSPIPCEWHSRVLIYEPVGRTAMEKELDKRNFGLNMVKPLKYTHFISMDADELYDTEEFQKAKERFHVEPDLKGLVCPLVVYFKEPTLQVNDITLVPHIHKLTATIKHAFNRSYPHAWKGNQIRIDPTRSYNINDGVAYTDKITMHHFSHVRKDYEKKLRNSTARDNINKSPLREDYANAKPGYFSKFYQQTLKEVPDQFGIGTI